MENAGKKLTIVGLGLLGGSIALAARARGLFQHITAVGRRDLSPAVKAGIIDEFGNDLAAACADADMVILCTPVDTILEQLPLVMAAAKPGAIVTDVGSTKERLVARAHGLASAARYVGSHPMVGSHLTGWEHAREDLIAQGITYVTLTESCDAEAAAETGRFWAALGARIVYIHPQRHDQVCALLSHAPHMAAVAVVELLGRSREDINMVGLLAGTGLRDTTRIAMGSADVWTEIARHNGENIATLLENLGGILHEMAEKIRRGDDSLRGELDRIAVYRRGL